MKKVIWLLVLAIAVSGCATRLSYYSPVYLSTDKTTTAILIKFTVNIWQSGVTGHWVSIDDGEDIQVDAISELPVYLNPGTHKLRFVSFSSLYSSLWDKIPKDKRFIFGKPIEEEIYLKENEVKVIKYTAPFLSTMKGKIEIIN